VVVTLDVEPNEKVAYIKSMIEAMEGVITRRTPNPHPHPHPNPPRLLLTNPHPKLLTRTPT
jgi:hypothetical protein